MLSMASSKSNISAEPLNMRNVQRGSVGDSAKNRNRIHNQK